MANETIPEITLNDGYKMAAIQFGTFQIRGGQGLQQTMAAIKDGYRAWILPPTTITKEWSAKQFVDQASLVQSFFCDLKAARKIPSI